MSGQAPTQEQLGKTNGTPWFQKKEKLEGLEVGWVGRWVDLEEVVEGK